MTRLAALAMLLLASCDDVRVPSRGEVAAAELNARLALDRAERLERRVSELEAKAGGIDRMMEARRRVDDAVVSDMDDMANTISRNADIYNAHVREYRQHTH